MSAIANGAAANFLNATLPTATGGKPTATFWTAGGYSVAAAMLIRLNSVAYSGVNQGSAEQTQLASGNGYVTGGTALGASSAASVVSNVETVTLPAGATSWTNTSGGWTICSLDLTDSAAAWTWYGNFNGQPIAIANGNTFQIAANAVTVTLN